MLHGREIDAFGDASYQGAAKRPEAEVRWHIAMRPGKRAQLKEDNPLDVLIDELERVKASIRAKVGLKKNTGPAVHAVCTVQPVEGAQQTVERAGMSALEKGKCGAIARESKPVAG